MQNLQEKLEREVNFSFARSSGPGGQNVNKVNSKAILAWDYQASQLISAHAKDRFPEIFEERISNDGIITISSDSFRDQSMNKSSCLEKLIKMIESAEFVPKKRRKTKPTRSSVEKRLNAKRSHSEKKNSRRFID